MECWVQSWRPCTNAMSYEVLHLSRKIILAHLKIWCSKMQPLSGNQRPDLLTSLMNMSLVLRLPREMHLCRSSSNVPRSPSFLDMLQNPHVLLTFDKVHNPLCVPRVVRACGVFNMLTSKCASRHNGVHFFRHLRTCGAFSFFTCKCASRHNGVHSFDISTSKSAPNPSVFYTFDFEMCFAPQQRAIFISHLASWLRTRRFSEPTFRPSRATTHWKNRVFRDFPAFFLRTWIFFLLRLSLFWSSFFFSSLLWLFPSLLFICRFCRKFDF